MNKMFNVSKVRTGLNNLVGFFNFYDPSYKQVTQDLTTSTSGLFIQNIHPLCSLENIVNVAPEFDRFDFPVFSSNAASYAAGSIVTSGGDYYEAKFDLLPPMSLGSQWNKIDLFSRWLKNIYNAACNELISDIIRYKKLETETRTLNERLKLFDGLGSLNERLIKRGRFCGLTINISNAIGLQVLIDAIGLQVDTVQPLPIYLFHSEETEPVKIITLNSTNSPSFTWQPVTDVLLATQNSTGTFYLGYYENDLVGQAIKRVSTWMQQPCQSCSDYNVESYNTWSKLANINAFSIPAVYASSGQQIADNISRISYDPSNNFGLNLSLSISCDLTDIILKNKNRFADALGMKVCLKLLNEIAMTTRMNVIADTTKALALADLSVKDEESLYNKYTKEIQALSIDLSSHNSVCMATKHRQGIRYKAV